MPNVLPGTPLQSPYGTFTPPRSFFYTPSSMGVAGRGSKALLFTITMMAVIFFLSCFKVHQRGEKAISAQAEWTSSQKNADADTGSKENPSHYRYGIMMDLGSSGSRLYVYRWQPAYPLRSIIQLGLQNTNPGVSWYVSKTMDPKATREAPIRVGTSLLPLVDFARTIIPPEATKYTPIHARCTAGCRMLDGDGVEAVMQGVRMVLSTSGFRYHHSYVEEMSGEMEAILDWVSINAALGLLHQPTYYQASNQVFTSPTVGVMDVGGGSAQIAYPALPVVFMNEMWKKPRRVYSTPIVQRPVVFSYGDGLFHLRLVNGVEHTIYAVSRIHYGMHDAQKLVVSNDVDGPQKTSTSKPCQQPKCTQRTSGRQSSREMQYHPCVQKGVYQRSAAGTLVTGSGDAMKCLKAVQAFFTKAEANNLGNISHTTPAPAFNLPFLPFAAMNNFYRLHEFAMHALGRDDSPKASRADLLGNNHTRPFNVGSLMKCMAQYPKSEAGIFLQAAMVTCPLGFAELQLRFGTLLDAERLRDSCFGLVHMNVLLSQVYAFGKEQHFHPMHATSRCPGLVLPDVDKQYPRMRYVREGEQANLRAMYSSSWTLGGMVLAMEESEAVIPVH